MGVDISARMIELAGQEEAANPLMIEYIVGDVQKLGEIGRFDLVVAPYLLNYARSKEQLLDMCRAVVNNLKPGVPAEFPKTKINMVIGAYHEKRTHPC